MAAQSRCDNFTSVDANGAEPGVPLKIAGHFGGAIAFCQFDSVNR